MTFVEKLRAAWKKNDSLLCVGLDPDPKKFPEPVRGQPDGIFEFCRAIVDATADLVCAFKPQIAYFAAERAEGQLEALMSDMGWASPAAASPAMSRLVARSGQPWSTPGSKCEWVSINGAILQ